MVFTFAGEGGHRVQQQVVSSLRAKGLKVITNLRPVDSAEQYREMAVTLNLVAYVDGEYVGEGDQASATVYVRSGVTGLRAASTTFAGERRTLVGRGRQGPLGSNKPRPVAACASTPPSRARRSARRCGSRRERRSKTARRATTATRSRHPPIPPPPAVGMFRAAMRLAVEVSTCSAERTGIGYYTEHFVDALLATRVGGRRRRADQQRQARARAVRPLARSAAHRRRSGARDLDAARRQPHARGERRGLRDVPELPGAAERRLSVRRTSSTTWPSSARRSSSTSASWRSSARCCR